ncbi:MAG: radical SAM protein [Verrucomicrobia bacterium]|nr:radical SAM protein [Verrucomicrobiota bacterium]
MVKKVLVIIPPLTQLNAPYAAGPFLAGFLREHRVDAKLVDASLELALRVFSRRTLEQMVSQLAGSSARTMKKAAVGNLVKNADRYAQTIEPVVMFLQGRSPELAAKIAARRYLPEGPRFQVLGELQRAHGARDPLMGVFTPEEKERRARYLASLYVDDLVDAINGGIDGKFFLSRYAEKLAVSAPSFGPLRRALETEDTLVDQLIDELAGVMYEEHRPDLVALTVPFPGNVYGALRISRAIKKLSNGRTRIALGGGYPSTELREISAPEIFDYVDYIVLDHGLNTLLWLSQHDDPDGTRGLCRTFVRKNRKVIFVEGRPCGRKKLLHVTPSCAGLQPSRYISMAEVPNPMHSMWSEGWWNKLVLAHGCYWHKCSFCDTALDYIGQFSPASATKIVDSIEEVREATGEDNFHFVDEAAPPGLLAAVSEMLISRGVKIRWWTNIRFERGYTHELARLMARSGCVAVTGGMEGVTDRLLKLVNKGITLADAVKAMEAFSRAGIMVHAYLMYGIPGQTVQDTVDALEIVRRLFVRGYLKSAYWHRFALTAHSPMYRNPGKFGIRVHRSKFRGFARNEIAFDEPRGCDHEMLGAGLRAAIYNFVHGSGLDFDAQAWFSGDVPKPNIGALDFS